MIKNRIRFFTLSLIIFTNFLFAQQRNLWNKIEEVGYHKELAEKTNLTKFEAYELEKYEIWDAFFEENFPETVTCDSRDDVLRILEKNAGKMK